MKIGFFLFDQTSQSLLVSSPDMSHTERLTTLAMIPVLNLGEEMG